MKYVLLFIMACSAIAAFPPSLTEFTTRAYVIAWIGLLALSALLAFIGSFRSVVLEGIGCAMIALALASYSAAFFAQVLFNPNPWVFVTLAIGTFSWVIVPVWRAGNLSIYIRTRRKLRREGLIR